MTTEKTPKNAEKYNCKKCNFKCSKLSDYNRHLLTAKHKNTTNTTNTTKIQQIPKYVCECGRAYKHRASLFNHKKTCQKNAENAENAENSSPPENIVHESISETTLMKCFQTMMAAQSQSIMDAHMAAQTAAIEQAAQMQAKRDETAAEQTKLLIEAITLNSPQTITNTTNNNTNTTNNQFNLNVFLNEDCKDAYTLTEVMNTIECTVSDLDRMDHDGYVATVTRKFLESIQDMAITERPIHCTDARRNTVCVKNETGWEKNEKAMKMLVNSVYFIGGQLGNKVQDWRVAYPDHYHGTVSRREQYHRMIDDVTKVIDRDIEAQIASKVCKGIVLDRKTVMNR